MLLLNFLHEEGRIFPRISSAATACPGRDLFPSVRTRTASPRHGCAPRASIVNVDRSDSLRGRPSNSCCYYTGRLSRQIWWARSARRHVACDYYYKLNKQTNTRSPKSPESRRACSRW